VGLRQCVIKHLLRQPLAPHQLLSVSLHLLRYQLLGPWEEEEEEACKRLLGPQQLCLRSGWGGVQHLFQEQQLQQQLLGPLEEEEEEVYNMQHITYNR
jgi:hypothetical protein